MTSGEKKVVFTIIGIMLVVLIIVFCVKMFGGNKDENKNAQNSIVTNKETNIDDEFSTILDNGTKLNNSSDLNSAKTYKEIEITNIQFSYNPTTGFSTILADLKNTASTTHEVETVNLKLKAKDGTEISTIQATLPKAEAGETVQLNANISADLTNAADFEVIAK